MNFPQLIKKHIENQEIHGATWLNFLYNEIALDDERNLTSHNDWKVPTANDYRDLFAAIGSEQAGSSWAYTNAHLLKDESTQFWNLPHHGSNDFGFNLKANGGLGLDNEGVEFNFAFLKKYALLWCKDKWNDRRLSFMSMYNSDTLYVAFGAKKGFYGVRLFRDTKEHENDLIDGTPALDYVCNNGMKIPTVKIGNQVWLADNLCDTHFRNGDEIKVVNGFDGLHDLEQSAQTQYMLVPPLSDDFADLDRLMAGHIIDVHIHALVTSPINEMGGDIGDLNKLFAEHTEDIPAHSEPEIQYTPDEFFTVVGDTIVSYNEAGGSNVVIPPEINGATIKKIGGTSFNDKGISHVIFPDTIEEIGSSAFADNVLYNVTFPDSIIKIEAGAFKNNKIVHFVMSNNIEHIGDEAFNDNQIFYNELIIPDGCTYVGVKAFDGAQFNMVSIPDTMAAVWEKSFGKVVTAEVRNPSPESPSFNFNPEEPNDWGFGNMDVFRVYDGSASHTHALLIKDIAKPGLTIELIT